MKNTHNISEGYQVESEVLGENQGRLDLKALRDDESVICEYKFRKNGSLVGIDAVHQLLSSASLENATKAILIANTGFTHSAHELVRHESPLNLQLLNFGALRNWAARLHKPQESVHLEVTLILKEASQKLAEMIAKDGRTLASMEWRDMERVMAEVFEGLGFQTELTPPSKDGGKDVIVSCRVSGHVATYFVEIKHWRSSTKVGSAAVQDLLNVVVSENVSGGLFLSTYGFTSNAFEQLTVINKDKIKFGSEEKIVSLCKTYVRARSGIWSQPEDLSELIVGTKF